MSDRLAAEVHAINRWMIAMRSGFAVASGVNAIDMEVAAEALDLHPWPQLCRLLRARSRESCDHRLLRLCFGDMGACLFGQGHTIST